MIFFLYEIVFVGLVEQKGDGVKSCCSSHSEKLDEGAFALLHASL